MTPDAAPRHSPQRPRGHNDRHLEPDQVRRERGEVLPPPLHGAILNDDMLALDIAKVPQPLLEGLEGPRTAHAALQIPAPRHVRGRLGHRGEWDREEDECQQQATDGSARGWSRPLDSHAARAATMVMSMVRPLLGRRGPAVEGIDQGLRLLITTASSSPGPRRRGTVAHGGEPSVPARCELAQSSTAL